MASRRKCIMLTLVRCGETTWDVEGRLHGRSDLPLSIDGRTSVLEAAAVLEGIRVPTVFHPPDDAAAETGQIVARIVGGRTKAQADLADANLGVLEGLSAQEFAERFPKRYKQWQEDPLTLTAPDGEDMSDARSRLYAAVARLVKRSRSDEVAIVLHPLALGLLRCWLADRPSSDLWATVRGRPRIERYVLSMDTAAALAAGARAQVTRA